MPAEARGVGIVYTATVREAEALAASLAGEGVAVDFGGTGEKVDAGYLRRASRRPGGISGSRPA